MNLAALWVPIYLMLLPLALMLAAAGWVWRYVRKWTGPVEPWE